MFKRKYKLVVPKNKRLDIFGYTETGDVRQLKILREDGGTVLREDGGDALREEEPTIPTTIPRRGMLLGVYS